MMTNDAGSVPRTVGSLCSGTGALDQAVPGQIRWVAEKEDAPAWLLKREHPDVPNFGDILTTDWSHRAHHVDLLTSGDPCQSMSGAGRQLASNDVRFLWPHVIEIIRIVRPLEIFLENVQNLVSVPLVRGAGDYRGERGSVLKMRLDDLRAAGYAVRWMVLGACAVGAPHHRHRWFLRATYVGADAPRAVQVMAACGAPKPAGRRVLPTPNARDGGQRGTPTREHALRRVANPERSVNLEDAAMAYLLPDGGQHWGKFADAVALWETITGRPAPAPTVPAPRGGGRLNPELSEWMMGYPLGYLTSDLARNDALRAAGNGVVTLQARAAWDLLAPTA